MQKKNDHIPFFVRFVPSWTKLRKPAACRPLDGFTAYSTAKERQSIFPYL